MAVVVAVAVALAVVVVVVVMATLVVMESIPLSTLPPLPLQ
jgi:hypothetical protein